jgi:uncharacterized protein (DUF427 family)
MSRLPVTPIIPQAGQESVWDYPRPPRLEPAARHITIDFAGVRLADSRRALRVLETSHPPVYYIPPDEILMQYLTITTGSSYCEWKGSATYYTVQVGNRRAQRAAWAYLHPTQPYHALAGHVAFYPALMDVCTVDGESVEPQPGGFYGGWITHDIVGPFKGIPGSMGW